MRTAVVSGRPLSWLQRMLPIAHLTLAGLYGLEVQVAGQPALIEAAPDVVRPVVAQVMSCWAELVAGRPGFLIEDKGLAVALHARWAERGEAGEVLERAQRAAGSLIPAEGFRLLGGDRFLEVAPKAAGKGRTIEALLQRIDFPGAVPVYFGDDDKDEEAFEVIRRLGGHPIGVGNRFPLPTAAERLPGPEAVRHWLGVLWHDWVDYTHQETRR
jgi:trehalose 6-phosphate phosphatase